MKDKVFYIYGAGIVACTIYTAIKRLYDCTPAAFYVSSKGCNPIQIDGIPVQSVEQLDDADKLCRYLVATPEVHHKAIADTLFQKGVSAEQLIFVDNRLESKLVDAYYRSLQEFTTASELLSERLGTEKNDVVDHESEISVFQAKCHVDKALQSAVVAPEYVHPIQVGAALTDVVIAPVRDNAGENISHKNRNYCELTATYYAWKNNEAQYKGLCHYRRIFSLTDAQVRALFEECDADVILPYPTIHYPDMRAQHTYCISDGDWNAMMQAMKEVAPDYYEAYVEDISKSHYFYNYNMLIAKRQVFDDYCKFLFAVLERAEELVSPKGWERADRFAGYLGENLTTFYFRKNRDRLKIVHAGKQWLT